MSLSVKDAFQILDLPVGADTTKVQINYHDQVLALEDDLVDASVFAILRVAYEVAIKYNNNNKIVDNIEQIIDVSYLIEGITILALLQELVTRYEIACMKEDDFWFEYYSKEANGQECDENCKEDIEEECDENLEEDIDEDDVEIPDFGYPDKDEARKLLTKIEELNFNSKDGSYSGILAEAYYHVLTEGLLHDKLKSLTWYQDRYNLVKKAIETDNSEIKNVDYILLAGKTLSKSENKDSLKKAIEYLLEIEIFFAMSVVTSLKYIARISKSTIKVSVTEGELENTDIVPDSSGKGSEKGGDKAGERGSGKGKNNKRE